jgi:hypothetical protein
MSLERHFQHQFLSKKMGQGSYLKLAPLAASFAVPDFGDQSKIPGDLSDNQALHLMKGLNDQALAELWVIEGAALA